MKEGYYMSLELFKMADDDGDFDTGADDDQEEPIDDDTDADSGF